MGNQVMNEADQRALTEAFKKVEAEEMGEGTHERCHQLARQLAEV